MVDLETCFTSVREKGNRAITQGWNWYHWKHFLDQFIVGVKGKLEGFIHYVVKKIVVLLLSTGIDTVLVANKSCCSIFA